MAHFAEIDENNIVLRTIVVSNDVILDNGVEQETKGIEFCQSLYGGTWVQTSYNGNFRKNYAGTEFTYDSGRDAFIPPKPFDSWLLDEDTCRWYAPVPPPDDGQEYIWNESSTSWILDF